MQIVPKMSKNSSTKQSSSPRSYELENLLELNSSLRGKNDILEDEVSNMKADQVSRDFEQSRLLRALEVSDEKLEDLTRKLEDLTRDLGSAKEAEAKAIKSCDRAKEYSKEVEAKMEALQRCVEEERGDFKGKLSVVKDELMESEAELKELRKMNKVWEGELGDLRGKNEELGKELGRIEAVIRVKDDEIGELKSENEKLLERIRVLENEKLEIVNNEDEKMEELKKEKEGLEREKRELMDIDKMEEKFFKFQNDIATCCWSVAKKGDIFPTSLNEKILSLVDDALNEKPENYVVFKEVEIAGNLDAEIVKRTMLSSEEPIGETGAACVLKIHSPDCVEISSDDDEIPRHASSRKRAKRATDDTSSNGSQNPKRKMKKLSSGLGQVTTIRKCNSKQPNIFEYMEKHEPYLKKNEVVDVADMVLACQKDPEFCTKAVCALYRNDLMSFGEKGLLKRDIDRGIVLAKYLLGGNPNSDKKKSVDELKQRYPDGLDICNKLVVGYSDKLFDIFKSNQDHLFSQKSTKMHYR